LPQGEPFISVSIDKIIVDENDVVVQTIGEFDRIYKKFSDIGNLPIEGIADDGIVDPLELYSLIAKTCYIWVIGKHGGSMVGDRLVIE